MFYFFGYFTERVEQGDGLVGDWRVQVFYGLKNGYDSYCFHWSGNLAREKILFSREVRNFEEFEWRCWSIVAVI